MLLAAVSTSATRAYADDVRPVQLEITERTPGAFLVQWRVPRVLAPTVMPGPVLPEHCRADDRVTVEELAGAWINRQSYVCDGDLAGYEVGMQYPALNVALSTLVRVELLSGDSYSHMLVPGELAWRIPDADAGGFPRLVRDARAAAIAGARHALRPAHLALMLAACLFGMAGGLRLAATFTLAQFVGLLAASLPGIELDGALAEVAVALAAGLLARQALLLPRERRQLVGLAAIAGGIHGLGVAASVVAPANYPDSSLAWSGMTVIGMDALTVAMIMAVVAVAVRATGASVTRRASAAPELAPAPMVPAYMVAVMAFTVAMIPPAAAPMEESGGLELSSLPVPASGVALGGTGRVAAPFADAPVQLFVAIDAFEVRRETLVRVAGLASELGVEVDGQVAIDEQPALKDRIVELVAGGSELTIAGAAAVSVLRRVDFMEVDAQGALPRAIAVVETVADALVGVTEVYLLPTTPEGVTLEWRNFDLAGEIPVTITDPEASNSLVLSAVDAVAQWDNELANDPIPVITATIVEPAMLWLPALSLVTAAVSLWLCVLAARRRDGVRFGLARMGLAAALLFAPVANVAVAMPASWATTPDAAGARRILAGVLPNIYKAFEFRSEEAAFDRLALSVTGETLTEVYLEHQRALEMEERGGARARVEAFEVADVRDVEAGDDGGFTAEATWTIGGTVVHFGHRHFRQNRYDARIDMVPVDGVWKIRSITVLDEERLR